MVALDMLVVGGTWTGWVSWDALGPLSGVLTGGIGAERDCLTGGTEAEGDTVTFAGRVGRDALGVLSGVLTGGTGPARDSLNGGTDAEEGPDGIKESESRDTVSGALETPELTVCGGLAAISR